MKELHVAKNFFAVEDQEEKVKEIKIIEKTNAVRIPYEEGGKITWKTYNIIQK